MSSVQSHYHKYHPQILQALSPDQRLSLDWIQCRSCHDFFLGDDNLRHHHGLCPHKRQAAKEALASDDIDLQRALQASRQESATAALLAAATPYHNAIDCCPAHKRELLQFYITQGLSVGAAEEMARLWSAEDLNRNP